MDDEYKIELNLVDAPPVKYPYSVGRIANTMAFQPEQPKSEMSYFDAFMESQLSHRVGIWASTAVDKVMRSYDQADNLDNRDEGFDPFKVWKDGRHQPDEFNTIANLNNYDEYNLYVEQKSYQDEAAKRLSESGIIGQSFALLADPTLYLGFGAESAIAKGLAAKGFGRAGELAATSAASVAAYETVQQVVDTTDRRDAVESLANVAAAGVIGGVLGKAVETWAGRSAAGKLKTPDNFHETSFKYVEDAQTLETRAQDLSAAVMKAEPEDTMVLGPAARFAAVATRYLSPKQFAQTARDAESRALGDAFFGRNLKTVADEKGVARAVSVGEETRNIVDQSFGQIAKDAEEIEAIVKSGKIYDEAARKEALILASNGRRKNLSGNEPATVLARQYRNFFGDMNTKLRELNIRGYNTRNDYGAPLLIKADLVNKNIIQFAEKVLARLEKSKLKASQDLSAMENELERMKAMGAKESDILEHMDEMRAIRDFVEESAADTVARSRAIAIHLATGLQNKTTMGPYMNKLIPNRFKQRVLDFETFIDFVETDPAKLKALYAREVAPFMASQKVMGDKTPTMALEIYQEKIAAKVADLKAAGKEKEANKLTKEAAAIADSVKKGWDVLTGEHLIKQADVFGAPVMNVVTAAKHFTSMTRLGNQVLGSLGDMNAIILHHHFKGISGFYGALKKMSTSPDIRKISKKNALTIGVSFEKSIHAELMNNLANDFTNAEIFGTGVTGKIAKTMQYGSSKMQVYNGATMYDTIVRRALSVAQQGIFKNNISDLLAGRLSKNDVTDLAFLGISKSNARPIAEQMKKYGEKIDGVFFANSHLWDNASAKEVFERAMLRDNRRSSLRPTMGDTPHAFNVPVLNLLTQFKSWAVTAGQVYGISSLQRADAKHLMGIATLIGLSSMASALKDVASGHKVETDPEELLWAGINNSGLLGVLPDYGGSWLVNTYADINSGGGKYADYQTPTKMISGTAAGAVNDIWGVSGRPIVQAIDPDKDVNWEQWQKSLINAAPLPYLKPYVKNELFKND